MISTTEKKIFSYFSYLQCAQCDRTYDAHQINSCATCDSCGSNFLVSIYEHLAGITPAEIDRDVNSMWRYFSFLPVFDKRNIVSLGEGFTPILKLDRLGNGLIDQLLFKNEAMNPTGSFKDRGMSVAISKARELGIEKCIVPTAGNAGGAMSAYCAKAGIRCVVVMPEHTPEMFKQECRLYGADVILEKGLINDCAKRVRQINVAGDYFDLSTLKEPYRLEGKKTMGFEIAEQLKWKLPDVILYPTGGGTGLIGIWKAFHEMIDMGWIPSTLPRMIAVQAENCQPVVETWLGHQLNCHQYHGNATIANGLAVPQPFAEKAIIKILHESNGKPISVNDGEIVTALKEIAKKEGLLVAPEGAALWAALKKLTFENYISPDETVLMLNTGSGYKYLENIN